MITDILGWAVATVGALIVIAGAAGVLRHPDVFTRAHAAGMVDSLGAALLLVGLGIVEGFNTTTARLLMVLAFLWFTGPTACHALARCAFAAGYRAWTADPAPPRRDTDPEPPA